MTNKRNGNYAKQRVEICLNECIQGRTLKMEMLVFIVRQKSVTIKILLFGVGHSRVGILVPISNSSTEPERVI